MLSKGLLPILIGQEASSPAHARKSAEQFRIVNLSARVGSINDNGLGGWYSYRMSKAALNMFTKTLSVEVKRYFCQPYALLIVVCQYHHVNLTFLFLVVVY